MKEGREGNEGKGRKKGKEGKGKEGKGTGCQSWRPRTILVTRTVRVPALGHPVLVPLGRPGARTGEPSPGAPELGAIGREGKEEEEGKGMKGRE